MGGRGGGGGRKGRDGTGGIDLNKMSSAEISAYEKTIPTTYGDYLLTHPTSTYADWTSSPEGKWALEVSTSHRVAVERENQWMKKEREESQTFRESLSKPKLKPPKKRDWRDLLDMDRDVTGKLV